MAHRPIARALTGHDPRHLIQHLGRDVVLRGSFSGVNPFMEAISPHLALRNLKPQRYEWRAHGAGILEKILRARAALEREAKVRANPSQTLR